MKVSKACVLGSLIGGLLSLTAPQGLGAEIALFPVSASGTHTITDNEIVLTGGGQRVFLEIFISGWAPSQLKTWQAMIDSSGYSSGLIGMLAPAVESCTMASECVALFGTGATCEYPPSVGVECTAGFIDAGRTDYIFSCCANLPAVDLFTLDFRYGSTLFTTTISDPGVPQYGGTLVLDVPTGAIGTFTIGFKPQPDSGLLDQSLQFITPLNLTPALITVQCSTNDDCDDGNACTNDTCEAGGVCSNADNYNPATHCCNPANGDLTPLEDGNDCTTGVCDPLTGDVTQDPLDEGTICGGPPSGECDAQDTCDGLGNCVDRFADAGAACGDPNETECDLADTCDGTGICQSNLQPAGTTCGDPTDTDCDAADTCDGAGGCQDNIAPSGATCGDPTDTDCDDPDTCDGAGTCLTNLKPADFPCGDPIGNQCDNPDTCDGAGTCEPNYVTAGTACGNPGDTECDNPDSCDGGGACQVNHELDGTLCTDDGNECREDVCAAGVCSHPLTDAGTPCGDPTETECDKADTCDGNGTCADNLEPTGVACGDPTSTDCDRADTCDGGGTCLDNIEPAGVSCGDPTDTDCDNPDTCDGLGTCLANVAPPGLPCGNPIGNQCDNPDTCDGAGVCESNFVEVGTACGNPNDTVCDNPDSCDGAGTCDPNREPDGTLCADDGNDCRDDVCLSGVCSHPLSEVGTPCGDQTETDCNLADTCDGAGTCVPNLLLAGTLCGDPSETECTLPDTCNGSGACLPNNLPNGTACGEDSFCITGATCLGGLCSGGTPTDCSDGLPCTTDTCNELLQQCEHDLMLGYCLIGDTCYSDGEYNPDNDCEVCTTAYSTTEWDVLPEGTPCDDGDPCTGTGEPGIGFDACDAAGVCVGTVDPNCNDDCINAVEVFDGSNIGNNDNRGPDDTEALCQEDSNNDVWFFYVATCPGLVVMDTEGSDFAPWNDTVLSVYDACGGNEIACDDDDGSGLLSLVVFEAVEGATYWIRVAGYADNSGDLVLNIASLDSCVIGGVCYAAGEVNLAGNECEACIPLLSSTSWSPRPAGSDCGDPSKTECDSADACDGNGVCEANHKPDGVPCSDEGNDCTSDVCNMGVCTHPPEPIWTPCGDPTSTECDNPDVCDGTGICLPDYVPAGVPCGDPSTSDCDNADTCDGQGSCDPNHQPDGLDCTDDGEECTFDVCETGVCTHPPQPAGTACGDSGDTQCDNPDSCDGFGSCLPNFEPSGFACGDLTDTECDNPDSCNGGGLCLSNFEPTGFACGDPTDTDCDNPDTCNGAGVCLDNLESVGFPCGDPSNTQCDNPDTCNGNGTCLSNYEPLGLACGDPSTSECDNADRCDGFGACDPNHQPDGIACSDDGEECTFDECDMGLCAHPPRPSGTACGDPSDTECDNPDSCDGGGSCVDNYELIGFACGDPADTECDNPDSCDGGGACLDNYEPSGFACGSGDDTECDNPDTCNGSGVCLDNYELSGFPCGDPSNTQCDNPDTCNGGGLCLDNFEPPGLACGDPSTSECDNADICDGLGACDPNHVTDGTGCTDDGNDCRDDICLTGECSHPPHPSGTACGDQGDTECDNPDTCDGAGACEPNYEPLGLACGDPMDTQCDNPDICDGGGLCDDNFEPDGTTCDDEDICTGADACQTGVCVGTLIAETPIVAGQGSRYLAVTPLPAGSPAPIALRLTSPDWPCLSLYIAANGGLVSTPVLQLTDDWGTVDVHDQEIVPSSTYHVVAECGDHESGVGSGETALWGDCVGDFVAGAWTPSNGIVDFIDITATVDGFRNLSTAPPLPWIDIHPCTPEGIIDFMDVTYTVDAFKGLPYPCPVPCP